MRALRRLAKSKRFAFAGATAIQDLHGAGADPDAYAAGSVERGILVDASVTSDTSSTDAHVLGFKVVIEPRSQVGFTMGLARFVGKRAWKWETSSDNLLALTTPSLGGVDGFVARYRALLDFFAEAKQRGLVASFTDETGYTRHQNEQRLKQFVFRSIEGVAALFGRMKDTFPDDNTESFVTETAHFDLLESRGRRDEEPLRPPTK